MHRIANTLTYGLRRALFLRNLNNEAKVWQEGIYSYPFFREEYKLFKEKNFRWRHPMMLSGPSRCGKTVLINQYLQDQPNWYIIRHNWQIVESCGMDIVKSFAVAYNNHIENLEKIYENPEIPKSVEDKWNLNKYLLKTPKIKSINSNPWYVNGRILDAISNNRNIYNGKRQFTILLHDFDSIHLKNKLEWTNSLLFYFKNLTENGFLKTIIIGKDPCSIYPYLCRHIDISDIISYTIGFLSKSDMMKYLQEKQIPLQTCEKIFDCFGGDIDIVSRFLENKENQINESNIEKYFQRALNNDLKYLKDIASTFSLEENKVLKEIYKELLVTGYMDYENYWDRTLESVISKSIEKNILSSRYVEYISKEFSIARGCHIIAFPFPRYRHIAEDFLNKGYNY